MLISFTKHFLFIANTKTASTTIEHNLRRHADISISATRLGKHMSYSQVMKNFKFVFKKSGTPAEAYFRFGVVRDPLDWVVSWYNYRHRDDLLQNPNRSKNSTHGISFEDFAAELMKKEGRSRFAVIGNQQAKFINKDGSLGVDYLIPLKRLDSEIQTIATELGINRTFPPEKKLENVSPKIISTRDVAPGLAEQLRKHYAEDLALFKKAEAGGFGNAIEIIRNKKQQYA